MEKQAVIERLCQLTTDVMAHGFNFSEPADCFCNEDLQDNNFQFSEDVILFIEAAVKEKLNNTHHCENNICNNTQNIQKILDN